MKRASDRGSWKYIPLLIACGATLVCLFFIERSVWQATGGVFMYPLDDPFIHMKMAENLAFHGVWGINGNEFASASSSILYTLLLGALFKLFHVTVIIPFVVNCAAAVALLYVIDKWLLQKGLSVLARTGILTLVVFVTPLPVLVVSGMEHTLQCLFSFLFVTGFSAWLEQSLTPAGQGGLPAALPGQKKLFLPVLAFAILVTGIRYEGLFLVAIACLLLLYYRKPGPALQLGLTGLLPVIVFGAISLHKGSYFLPNSVLVKSSAIPFSLNGMAAFLDNILVAKLTMVQSQIKKPGTPPPGISLLAAQRLLLILPLTYLLFAGQLKQRLGYTFLLAILTLCTLLHLSLAATGWLYRYEAYLILCTVTFVTTIAFRFGKQFRQEKSPFAWLFTILLLFALFFPFFLRSAAAFSNIRQACVNVYQQQYQAGKFFHAYYDSAVVAANDIGAISYFSNIRTVDLWGLGSIDIARSKKAGFWTPAFLDSLVRGRHVKLAMVYDEWFDPALLHRWTKVASWQLQNNVILGGDQVSFYAIDRGDSLELARRMREFRPSLPPGVTMTFP
jgi:hypothetical protein